MPTKKTALFFLSWSYFCFCFCFCQLRKKKHARQKKTAIFFLSWSYFCREVDKIIFFVPTNKKQQKTPTKNNKKQQKTPTKTKNLTKNTKTTKKTQNQQKKQNQFVQNSQLLPNPHPNTPLSFSSLSLSFSSSMDNKSQSNATTNADSPRGTVYTRLSLGKPEYMRFSTTFSYQRISNLFRPPIFKRWWFNHPRCQPRSWSTSGVAPRQRSPFFKPSSTCTPSTKVSSETETLSQKLTIDSPKPWMVPTWSTWRTPNPILTKTDWLTIPISWTDDTQHCSTITRRRSPCWILHLLIVKIPNTGFTPNSPILTWTNYPFTCGVAVLPDFSDSTPEVTIHALFSNFVWSFLDGLAHDSKGNTFDPVVVVANNILTHGHVRVPLGWSCKSWIVLTLGLNWRTKILTFPNKWDRSPDWHLREFNLSGQGFIACQGQIRGEGLCQQFLVLKNLQVAMNKLLFASIKGALPAGEIKLRLSSWSVESTHSKHATLEFETNGGPAQVRHLCWTHLAAAFERGPHQSYWRLWFTHLEVWRVQELVGKVYRRLSRPRVYPCCLRDSSWRFEGRVCLRHERRRSQSVVCPTRHWFLLVQSLWSSIFETQIRFLHWQSQTI